MVAFAFYISYTFMAIPSSKLLERTGLKKGMMYGLFLMSAGALVFIPAALTRRFEIFLIGLYIIGTGLAVLQTASNPYVTIMGPTESAAKRISILGICNKVAGALAPIILGYFVLNDGNEVVAEISKLGTEAKAAKLDELALRLINPYLFLAGILFVLGLIIRFSPLPELEIEESTDDTITEKNSIFQFPHLIVGAIALFVYVGAEVIAADTLPIYGKSLGFSMDETKFMTTYTLIAMIVGYILGIALIPKTLSQRTALIISSILGIVFTFAVILTNGFISIFFVAILGFANAIVWPAIWPLAIHNLGKFIKMGSALLIMAIAGGAILPLVWGEISENVGEQLAYLVLVPCYLIILFFAVRGYKLKSWK